MTTGEQQAKNVDAFEKCLASTSTAQGASIAPLTEIYVLATITPIKGRWYFGIDCPQCKLKMAMLADESNGQRGNPFSGPGGLQATCRYCLTETFATSSVLQSFEWT